MKMYKYAALLGATLVAGSALAEKTPLQPMDVFELKYASDVQIAPDASRVVYVRSTPDVTTDMNYNNLWTVDVDGGNHYPLTEGSQFDYSPIWSPDGKELAYVSSRSGSSQIYIRSMETNETRRISNLPGSPQGLTWSPDGKQLAFAMFVPTPELQIGDMPKPPAGAKWAAPVKYTDKISFRRNAMGDVPTGYTQLFVISAEGGEPQQVTEGPYNFGLGGDFGLSPSLSWSKDGKSLIAPANLREDAELEIWDSEIYEFRIGKRKVTKKTARQLTDRLGPDTNPIVSPDGEWIAYRGYDEAYKGFQMYQLYVMNRKGGERRKIDTGLDRTIHSIQWKSDGSGLYGLYDNHGDTKLAFFPLSGGSTVLAERIGTRGFNYGAGTYSMANNGTYAITQSKPDQVGDVAVGTTTADTKRLTNLNAELFSKRELGTVEELWWKSSKDGRDIHGWIIKPPNFDPKKTYPLVLEIHGGPYGNYGPRFDTEKHMLAAAGYVVLFTNPRGSTSYGEEFANLIQHNYPNDEFYDLESGVDAVIEKGFIDEDRLYVAGGSGGGILTAWMIGNTNRYRAAVMYYPVVNWTSFALTADVSPQIVKYWFPGMPWDHPELYWERSVLSVVKNVKTPTLIMTGEEDWRTPVSESEQYFRALKLLGVETVLARVPGEGHAILGRPSHTMAKSVAILGWLKEH